MPGRGGTSWPGAPAPAGTECDPAAWWSALEQAGQGLRDRADAIAVAAQQHGMVVMDEDGQVIRPALLWNDLRSAAAARELIAELGGPGWWAEHTGSVPSASFTVTKLRWLAGHEPENAARVARVMLPHDWLTWRLASPGPGRARAGGTGAGRAEPVTDRGTGYFSPAAGRWLPGSPRRRCHEPGLPGSPSPRWSARPRTAPCWPPGPATTWAPPSGSAWSRASWSSRSARRARRTRSPSGPRRTSPAWSRGSPTRPAGSCR